jgi:hypothetical protein
VSRSADTSAKRVHLDSDGRYGVGVHRYAGPPRLLEPGVRMFTFVQDTLL